jgi:hypothetical protein
MTTEGEELIRFKCIYCGQRILAPDNGAGKKGKCPKCQHELRVPKSTISRPAIGIEKTEPINRLKDTASQKNLPLTKIPDMPEYPDDAIADLIEEKAGWLIPVYDELALFLMAATLILLYIVNSSMREQVYKWIASRNEGVYLLMFFFLIGMGLSIYHIFTKRDKSDAEKWIMIIFAVLANAVTAIIAGFYVLKHSDVRNWLIVFPMWNMVNGVLLLVMLRFRIIDEECVSDRNATAGEVIIGLTAVLIIFIFCNYVFKLHWAITFSICIVYTTSFDKALQSVFPGLKNRDDEETESAG